MRSVPRPDRRAGPEWVLIGPREAGRASTLWARPGAALDGLVRLVESSMLLGCRSVRHGAGNASQLPLCFLRCHIIEGEEPRARAARAPACPSGEPR